MLYACAQLDSGESALLWLRRLLDEAERRGQLCDESYVVAVNVCRVAGADADAALYWQKKLDITVAARAVAQTREVEKRQRLRQMRQESVERAIAAQKKEKAK